MKSPAPRRQMDGHRALFAAAAGLLLLAAGIVWVASDTRRASAPADTVGGPFTLTDDHGQTVTDRSYPGKYKLIYFGYAACPDICPTTLSTIADALDHLGPIASRIQPLFITIDPSHDTPAILRHYVRNFSPSLVGLTGTERQLDRVWEEYHVVRIAHPRQGMSPMLDHSAVIYFMAPDGHFLAPISADASGAAMAGSIVRLVTGVREAFLQEKHQCRAAA